MTSSSSSTALSEPGAMPKGCTNVRVRQLTRVLSQQYDAYLIRSGLRTTQYSLLSCLLRESPIRPVDLARLLKMDASTLTRNLKPVIDAGWVEMGQGVDGRSRLVYLTAAGRAKREEGKSCWSEAQAVLNEQLGVERVIALHALIDESLLLLGAAHDELAAAEQAPNASKSVAEPVG